MKMTMYSFPTPVKEALEQLDAAFAIYQYIEGKIVTVLVTNGLVKLMEPGMSRQDAIDRLNQEMDLHTHPDDLERVQAENFAFISGESDGLDLIYRKKLYGKNAYALLHAKGSHQLLSNGVRLSMITYDDMTAAIAKETSFQGLYEKSLFSVIDNRKDGYAIVDQASHKIEICNSMMKKTLNITDFSNHCFEDYFCDQNGEHIDLERYANHHEATAHLCQKDSDVILRVSAITWDHHDCYMVKVNQFDFRYFDAMTKLPSMTFLRSNADQVLDSVKGRYLHPVVVFIDIRSMKTYNRAYGFKAGDLLLGNMARILENVFTNDFVFKFSEDHFVVITGDDDLTTQLLKVEHQGKNIGKGLSIDVRAGIYYLHDEIADIMDACDRAKLACDSIKSEPEELFRIYDDSLTRHSEIFDYVVEHIDEAIENHYIHVYMQPVIRTLTGQMCSMEALSRWIDPKYGMLNPADFIGALEETHQIAKLDLYVINSICAQMRHYNDEGHQSVPVSFNLSRLDFITCNIFEEVEKVLAQYHIDRSMIHIEITESIMATNSYVREQVKRFKEAGYQVWMDDFGSGYSSLNLLKDYDFDELKLDMAFLSNFNQRSKDIITSVVVMAKKIGIQTLAEGVETKEQYDFLKEIGCEKVQGYYFGKPMLPSDVYAHMQELHVSIENHNEEAYYRKAGAINTASHDAIGILENDGHGYRYLYYNNEYRNFMRKFNLDNTFADYDALQKYTENIRADVLQDGYITNVSVINGYIIFLNVKRIAHHEEKSIYELWIDAAYMDGSHQHAKMLNSFLSEMVRLYDIVNIVNIQDDYVDGFIEEGSLFESGLNRTANVTSFRERYAKMWIHPDDRIRYLKFVENHQLMEHIIHSPKGNVSDRFRTYNEKTQTYEWKLYTELLLSKKGKDVIMELIKTSIIEEQKAMLKA